MQFSKSFLKKSIGTNNRGEYYDNIRTNNIETNNIETNNIETNNTYFSDTNSHLEQSHKEKERELKEREQKEREQKIREQKEREIKEQKEREQKIKEQKEREIKEKKEKIREIREKIREQKEREIKEQKEREQKIREQKEREQKEREQKEREQKIRELKERELKERELKERELKERELKERELKERELKERELKEKELKEKELKERELKEREQKIREQKIRELKERELKEKEIAPNENTTNTEPNILKLLKQKTITIENVYQEKYNNINATGLGDFIRGSYFLMEFCDKNNILFNINILNHPISQFLEIYQNKQPLIINNINKFEEINFQPHISNNNIITNTYDYSTNNKFIYYLRKQHAINKKIYTYIISYPSEKIDEKHKEYMKQILQPCKQLELIVDNTLLELELVKKQFIIIHIRYGDDFLIKKKKQIKKNHLEIIQNILDKLDLNQKYLLISDNIIIKNILSLKYPFIKTHFNKISHTGEGLKHETIRLQNTMIDFNMFSHASRVIAFSIYNHGTGFSKWTAETYSVPYICRYLP